MDKRESGIERSIIENEPMTEVGSVQFYLEELQRMNNQLVNVQRELTRALKAAENAKKEKEQFFSTMSHDIRIPLNAIRGMTQMALDDIKNTEGVKENLQIIQSSSEYVISIVTDILDIGQMESNSSPLEEVDFCLQDEINNIQIMMNALFNNKNQTFICKLPETSFYLHGSWKHVSRIITNLLSNASKYTQDGGDIVLTVTVDSDENNIFWTTISVQDNGMGMTERQLKSLFTPYFRTDRESVKLIQGTGLGLTIVKRFVELCSGSIRVISEEGRGSDFIVKIPFVQAIQKKETMEDLLKAKMQNKHICYLICEDNLINTKIVSRLFGKYAIEMDSAQNGAEGVAMFRKNPQRYTGVLMDIHMPVMGGIEATDLIRRIDPDIPIIALTGDTNPAALKKMRDVGISTVLEKPLDAKKFYETIYDYI